jgi:hypothetical protein
MNEYEAKQGARRARLKVYRAKTLRAQGTNIFTCPNLAYLASLRESPLFPIALFRICA